MSLRILFTFGLVIYLVTALNSHGFLHGDEHFQIVEFADAKLGKSPISELPWEYDFGLRSAIQPSIAFGVFKTLDFIGYSDPYGQVTALRLLSALLALFSISYLIKTVIENEIIRNRLLFVFCALTLSFLPYLNVRFSSETWSGLLFLIPLAHLLKKDAISINPILIGVFLGLSFLFRYQAGLLILGLLLWMILIKKFEFKIILKTIVSILGIVGLGILIDSWFYGEFTLSAWNYFSMTILGDVAPNFGTQPWHFYITETLQTFGTPIGIALLTIVSAFFIVFRKHPITWAFIPFLLVHFFIPHKEYRFLFPVVNLLPILIFMLLEKYISWQKIKEKRGLKYFAQISLAAFLIFNLLFTLALSIESAGIGQAEISRFIHTAYPEKSVNLLNTKWASPYKPWGAPMNHYLDENVTNIEVDKLHDDQYQENSVNLIVVREIDLKNSPKLAFELEKHNAELIKESYNIFTQVLGRSFGIFNLNNNLKLYAWEKGD